MGYIALPPPHLAGSASAVVSLSVWSEECLPFDLIHSIQGQDLGLSVECVHSAELLVKSSVLELALILFVSEMFDTVLESFYHLCIEISEPFASISANIFLNYWLTCSLPVIKIWFQIAFVFIEAERNWISCHCPHSEIYLSMWNELRENRVNGPAFVTGEHISNS